MSVRGALIRVLDGERKVVASAELVNDGDYLIGRDAESAEIALPDASVSRRHCLVRLDTGRFSVRDAGSTNGSRLGRRRLSAEWTSWELGEALQVGVYTLFLAEPETGEGAAEAVDQGQLAAVAPALRPSVSVAFPERQFVEPVVAVEDLQASGYAVAEVDVLSIGGGAASFAVVNALRIAGLDATRIRVLAPGSDPLERLVTTCRALGLQGDGRLRSASTARLDNPWGAPGYGAAEAWGLIRRGGLASGAALLARLTAGSTLADPFGPRLEHVVAGVSRQAGRIGWPAMLLPGRALALRRTEDERFAVAYRTPVGEAEGEARNRFVVARHVHIATGWPTPRYSPLLEAFRRRFRSSPRAVSAFEPHDALYAALEADGGTVAVIGAGFEAAVVVDRLAALRKRQRNVVIVRIGAPTATQDDLWPADAWAGARAEIFAKAPASRRSGLARAWATPSIPEREDWRTLGELGEREGWYRRLDGPAASLALNGETVVVELAPERPDAAPVGVAVDHVIDCSLPPVDPLAQPFLRDLVATYGLTLNAAAADETGAIRPGLAVDDAFALPGLTNGRGLAFASGLPASGGGFGPIDSFLGHVMAARAITEDLLPALGLPATGRVSSLIAWLRWIGGRAP